MSRNHDLRRYTTRSIISHPSPALHEKPGVRIEDISYPITSHIPILVIDIDPIRQKQILLHPPFQLANSTSDIESALKDGILLQDSTIKEHRAWSIVQRAESMAHGAEDRGHGAEDRGQRTERERSVSLEERCAPVK